MAYLYRGRSGVVRISVRRRAGSCGIGVSDAWGLCCSIVGGGHFWILSWGSIFMFILLSRHAPCQSKMYLTSIGTFGTRQASPIPSACGKQPQDKTRHDKTRQHDTTQHNTTRHDTTQHNNTTQHDTTRHDTTQHNTTQHSDAACPGRSATRDDACDSTGVVGSYAQSGAGGLDLLVIGTTGRSPCADGTRGADFGARGMRNTHNRTDLDTSGPASGGNHIRMGNSHNRTHH
jgi:hypothetical protein